MVRTAEWRRGWLLDVYDDLEDGVVLWLLGDDGVRHRLTQAFPVTFFAHGSPEDLRAAWRYLRDRNIPIELERVRRRDLFAGFLDVLSVRLLNPALQSLVFRNLCRRFPDLHYYDADIPIALRHSAVHGLFPLARCQIKADADGRVAQIRPLDSPWDLEPDPAPLRRLSIEPDVDPNHGQPVYLTVRAPGSGWESDTGWGSRRQFLEGEKSGGDPGVRVPLQPLRLLLIRLQAALNRHDPDLIVSQWGDTWLFPTLIRAGMQAGFGFFNLNRDSRRQPLQHKENSFFTYGRVVFRGRQVRLFGRWHIDERNAVMFGNHGLTGVLEQARVTGLPVQEVARKSPGAGITAMQMKTALRHGVMIPYHKQQAEEFKSAGDLIRSDRGGLVFQPLIGIHHDVAEIDFVSMYPSIMAHFNISPETVNRQKEDESATGDPLAHKDSTWSKFSSTDSGQAVSDDLMEQSARHVQATAGSDILTNGSTVVPELGLSVDQSQEGLVPETLKPLLARRMAFKERLALLDHRDVRYRPLKDRSDALKWLLVVSFGYLGYKNARFGRIESHESVTAYGREALLRAKEAAEDLDYVVLHMYVDGLWVQKQGKRTAADLQPLLEEVRRRTGLPIALEGIYRWIVFLPSRLDAHVPVANRYFGFLRDGRFKIRGIEARRHDTPRFIAQVQTEMLKRMALVPENRPLTDCLSDLLLLLRRCLDGLKAGKVSAQRLLVAQTLSRSLDAYRQPSPAARAAAQLAGIGKKVRPGQKVHFLHTLGEPGVWAWDLPNGPNLSSVDLSLYARLLIRAASTVTAPLGIEEKELHRLLSNEARQESFRF